MFRLDYTSEHTVKSFQIRGLSWVLSRIAFGILCLAVAIGDGILVNADLVHRWSFNGSTNDSVGSANAILHGGASVLGNQLELSGAAQYATLPIDQTLSTMQNMTIETWATYDSLSAWARIFDFGNGDVSSNPDAGYLMLTGSPEYSSVVSFAQFSITSSNNSGSENVYAGAIPGPGVELHYALTLDSVNNIGSLYIDGALLMSGEILLTPSDIVSLDGHEHNWLGRSRFTQDSYLDGRFNEFRIYNRALSAGEVGLSFQRGPNAVPEPASSIIFSVNVALLALLRRRSKTA